MPSSMALPTRTHQFAHHPPHHYRKKRGSGSNANRLGQLVDQGEDLAGAMGGGSSRDASEEDNDAISEHSDSASSFPHTTSYSLSSPTQSTQGARIVHHPNALPTTARDRALVDSKAHHHNYSPAFAGIVPSRKTSGGLSERDREKMLADRDREREKTPGTTSPAIAVEPVGGAGEASSTARRPGSANNTTDSSISHTLTEAASVLSSSSELTPYAADDEGRSSSGSLDVTREDSLDSTASTSKRGGPSQAATNRPAAPLHLNSLPSPYAGSSSQVLSSNITPVAIPPIRSPFANTGPSTAGPPPRQPSSSASTNVSSDYLDQSGLASEADSIDVSQRPVGRKPTTARQQSEGDDGDVSDGGTASPYDGDVEFAARTPVSQQVTQLNGLHVDRDSGTSSPGISSSGEHLPLGDPTLRSTLKSTHDKAPTVRDVPSRKYSVSTQTQGSGHSLGQGDIAASSEAGPSQPRELSAAEVHARLVKINPTATMARLAEAVTGNTDSNGHREPLRLYLQTSFDVPTLSHCSSLLRTAKLCLGDGTTGSGNNKDAPQIRIIAGVVAKSDQGQSETLPLEQRAGLAKNCRWVDEVIEGVPSFSSLGAETDTEDPSQSSASLRDFLRQVGADWAARMHRRGEAEEEDSGDEDDEASRPRILRLPRSD